MFRPLTVLALFAAVTATPALAAKPILPTGGTSHGSPAPADNMADKLNGESLSATESGGAYTPKPMSVSTGDTMPMKGHHGMMRHKMRHMKSSGGMRPDETATPGMSNNPAATGNPVAK